MAEFISGDESRLIKIDCSNFSHGHEVANLTGSPLGFVGSDRSPLLSKKRIERYGTVLLFDEIEKGSEELYNLMLQILGDGKLQLGDGSTTSFRETIIILTSNLGAKEMGDHLRKTPVGFGIEREEPNKDVLSKSAQEAFKDFFKHKPEFVNRLDSMVVFNPLDKGSLGKVLDNKLAAANEAYVESYGMAISLTDGAHEYLVDKALEERGMGARPLVRAFEKDIQSMFGRYVGGQQVFQGAQINVYHHTECPEEVRRKYPENELIFTQHFDEDLWEKKEEFDRKVRLAQERREEARRKEEARKAAEEVVFNPGDQMPSDDEEPKE